MGKIIAGLAVVVIVAAGWMFFTDTDYEDGEMPEIDVQGGEMPDVEVRGPEVETGTRTVEVPTVDINAPEDDADGTEDEVIDDEGVNGPDVETDVNVDIEESDDPGNR